MAIPEAQLDTWSNQGSKAQSSSTYATVKNALEQAEAAYADRDFDVFLQGSYGNDTNVWAESDVDIIIRYNGAFFHNIKELSTDQQTAFNAHYPGASSYSYDTFKSHVQTALVAAFDGDVNPDKKAIKIKQNGSRRSADVVVAFEYRHYFHFNSIRDQKHVVGIVFFTTGGSRVANYPKQHSDNATAKHQATGNKYKHIVRIFKNMRRKLVDDGVIAKGVAPSYYIEGLLYNAPNSLFVGSYGEIVLKILQWLHQTTDRTKWVCVNERYYLLRDNEPVCWPIANGNAFITAVINLWNTW
jgi:hypothetical protein